MIDINAYIDELEQQGVDLQTLIDMMYNRADGTGEAKAYNDAVIGMNVKDRIVKLALLIRAMIASTKNDITTVQGAADYITKLQTTLSDTEIDKLDALANLLSIRNGKLDFDGDALATEEGAREEYTSVYGQLVPGVTWERGNIFSDGSAPIVGDSTKWMRTADYVEANDNDRLGLAYANNPRVLFAQVFFYSSAAVDGYIGKSGNIFAPSLIDCPEGTTHIKVALTTRDWNTTDGITGAMFPLYAKRVWITYADFSLLKNVTDQIGTKADKSTTQTAVSILNSSYGNLTALALESGYCDTDIGIEKTNAKRLRTGFLPYDENLVIVNKSYTGIGKYIQGFVTLYSADSYPEETPESIYIVRISGDKPAWTDLTNNFLNLRDYAWYNPKYFRLSLQWSDTTALTEQDVIDTVLLGRQNNGQIAEIARGQSGTDLLFSADDVKLTASDTKTFPILVSPGTRPVLIGIESSYTLAGGMAITPVKAELYPDCASDVAIETLNTNTNSITTYYLCATDADNNISEEVNGRLKISATAGGEPIGWINSCHAQLPKLNPNYYSTVKTSTGLMVYGERFVVGGNDTLIRQQFRMPPPQNATTCLRLTFVIPSGVTLNIRHMTARYENNAQNVDGGLRLDAHGAFFFYPEHTRKAFEIEAVCGASSIITIPKRSSDGVWFCYHDDYFTGNRLRKKVDGSWVAIPDTEAHYGQAFHSIPFSQLNEYRVWRDGWSALERLCLLSDYFALCAKQGIHPVLSFHPLYSDMIDGVREYARDAAEIKALAKRYGVLGTLSMKVGSGATTNWTATDPVEVPLKVLFGIFGNEIDGYIVTIEQNENQVDAIDRTATVFDALRQADDPLTAEAVIELYENKATAANVQTILNAGYKASIVQPAETVVGFDGDSRSVFHSNDYDYWARHGVTRFTTNKTASFGLNW